MTDLMCFFHPDIEADTKCEKCGKLLCLQCKRTYHTNSIDPKYAGTTGGRYELCPECFETKKQLRMKFQMAMCMICIIIVIIVIFVIFTVSSNMP